MKKRLYSVVLLFSFFFCSGGFLVAHADFPDPISPDIQPWSEYSTEWKDSSGKGFWATNPNAWTSCPPYGGTGTPFYGMQFRGKIHLVPGVVYRLTFYTTYIFSNGTSTTTKYFAAYNYPNFGSGITCYNYDTTDQSSYFSVSKDDTYSFNFTVPVRELGVYISGYNLISSFSTCRVEITDVDPSVAAQVSVGQGIEDKIEDQYNTSQSSELGSSAQDFADQASESLGVVSYVDTLFSGLSGLVTAGSTTLTFPAFAIAVQGTDYQVWEEHTFDLSQLDGWFSGLMAAVRLATSVVVVGAVIHYLQSVYKDVIG